MLSKKDFEYTYNLYYNSICKYLYLFTSDFSLIEDVVQTVFIKLWEDRDDIEPLNLKSYLLIAARSRILNAIRDKKKKDDLLVNFYRNELINNEADDIVDYDELYNVIQELITNLPEQTQIIYKLNRNEKLKYKEISTTLNISIKTVEKHISSALKYLNDSVKSYYINLKSFLLLLLIIIIINFF